MSNAAFVAAQVAAMASQADRALVDHLRERGATNEGGAVQLLERRGQGAALRRLLRRGFVRQVGADRYWLDEAACAAAVHSSQPWKMIAITALVALALVLTAMLMTR